MLTKFSVKKPFTIVVVVILIIIVGVVAYLNTEIDLLPEMELPYVVVMTTYVGASPEEVETQVTKPLEAALASLSGIETISSISAENYGMVILQFHTSTNMDSAMIELSSNVDMARGLFPDAVASPIVMRINPSMMPVMILAADKDGLSEEDFSIYVEETLVPALERANGVASVSAMGLVQEQVEILWDRAAIDALNDKILAEVDSELADAKKELDKAKWEIADGKSKLDEESEDAYRELADAASELSSGKLQLNLAENALDGAPEELEAARAELESARESLEMMLELVAAKERIDEYIYQMEDALEPLREAEDALLEEYGSYAAAKRAMDEQYASLESAKSGLDQALAAYLAAEQSGDADAIQQATMMLVGIMQSIDENDPTGTLVPADYQTNPAGSAQITSVALAASMEATSAAKAGIDELQSSVREAEAAYAELLSQYGQLEELLEQFGFMSEEEIYDAMDQIDDGLRQIAEAEAKLPGQRQELEDAKSELREGETELEKGKLMLSTELSSAGVQLALAEAQLDSAYEQFEEAREEAFKNAGLDGVLTPDMLNSILSASNFSMPAGYLEEDGQNTLVKVGNKFASIEELESLMLMDLELDTVGKIYLHEIADISLASTAGSYYAKVNGNPGIILTISKQSMFGTAEVSENINERMEQLMAADEGLHLSPLSDQGYYIRVAISAVLDNLLIGAILAVIILILFLRSIRPTVIVAVSIPVSLLFALGLMYFSGVSINVISLAGLALGVGMLVDNSIVVIENIIRLRRDGASRRQAAVTGARQVAGAITASTLTTVCVFLPIVFTEGLARQLFTDMGLTVAYSLVASLLVALTLIPTLASTTLKKEEKKEGPLHNKIMQAYAKAIAFVLKKKWVVIVPVVAVAAICVAIVASMGTSFIPEVDYGQVQITVSAGEEYDYSEEEVRDYADDITQRILDLDGIAMVGAFEGSMMGSTGLSEDDEYLVTLFVLCDAEQGLTGNAARAQIKELVADMPIEVGMENASFDLSALAGSGIEVVLRGDDTDMVKKLAGEIGELMAGVEGLTEVDDGLGEMEHELRVVVDKNKAMGYGLTVAQVYQEVAAALSAETDSMTLSTLEKDYPVVILDAPEDALTRQKLYDYSFTVEQRNADGGSEEKTVYLSDIASIEDSEGFGAISRVNQTRIHSITAAIDEGYNVGLVSRDLEAVLATYTLPAGYSIEVTGENEMIQETLGDLILMVLLACVFIYLIMVAQFQNLILPFIVILTIPIAFSGGLISLVVTGMEISVVAMLGFLVLSGVIVNNGIVYIDCVNQLRFQQQMEKRHALELAGQMRLRPILMTALTTIFALLSMVFSQQMGTELLRPMAMVAVGGLVYATFVTLFFVPVMYDLLIRTNKRIGVEEEMSEEEWLEQD